VEDGKRESMHFSPCDMQNKVSVEVHQRFATEGLMFVIALSELFGELTFTW
jgi:hypothetical protein